MKLFFEPVAHKEAVAFLESRAVVTREVFDELTPELKGLAFVITGIDDATQLQAAKTVLAKLPAGADYNDVRDELIAALPFAGKKAERRAELLLRHWGGISYAIHQYKIIQRQADVFPWLQYGRSSSIARRPSHAALEGIILRTSDPFWKTHWPPWAPGCNCPQPIPLMESDVEEIQQAEKHLPADKKSVLEGAILRKLQEEQTLIRGINDIHDVRTPAEMGESWVGWSPEDITAGIDLNKAQAQLDPEVWGKLVKFWNGKTIAPGTTVAEWLSKKPGKPNLVQGATTAAAPAPPVARAAPTALPKPPTKGPEAKAFRALVNHIISETGLPRPVAVEAALLIRSTTPPTDEDGNWLVDVGGKSFAIKPFATGNS